MDAPIVSDVREVPTEFASEGRSARACITFAFHTSLQADSPEAWTFDVEKPSNPNTLGYL
jgi:hypothetical protein